jgi:Zn-dependent peptidase ImmA (M78 family)
MTTWGDAHTRGHVAASELHDDLGTDLSRPVDVFGAVRRVGLVLAFAQLGPVSGMYLPRKSRSGIVLHEGHPRTRQRYTAGHELGHHVFGHTPPADLDLAGALQRDAGRTWTREEKEAEAFGAWFLMPSKVLRAGMKALDIERPTSPLEVYALSLWLGTSYTATARQLANAKLVDTNTADLWAKVPPRDVKAQLAGRHTPDDMQNDVWWLDAAHHGGPLDARPGDRVVLTLEEIPASGFSWRIIDLPPFMRLLADSFNEPWASQTFDPASTEQAEGDKHPRSLVIEIDPAAGLSIEHLRLIKDQPWDPGPASEELEVLVSVSPRLHGIQLPETELALAA